MNTQVDDDDIASLPIAAVSELESDAAAQQHVKLSGLQISESGKTKKIHTDQTLNDDLEHAGRAENIALEHPASTDDVLTHTIDLQNDPSMPSVTVRSMVLGMSVSTSVVTCKHR